MPATIPGKPPYSRKPLKPWSDKPKHGRKLGNPDDVGVIVGRFQVDQLHAGHKELFNIVCQHHPKVLVFLGLTAIKHPTKTDPLDYAARRQMLSDLEYDLDIFYIKDCPDDDFWSRSLDQMISDNLMPGQSAVLYGSRDSFIEHYEGKFPTVELVPDRILAEDKIIPVSGTRRRKEVGRHTIADARFRAGVVWALQNQYDIVIPTVDIAIVDPLPADVSNGPQGIGGLRILLGKRDSEKCYRFFGGHSNPTMDSYEIDAFREAREEAGVSITEPEYLFSHNVPDWRYRAQRDQIRTMLFLAGIESGDPSPGDDIDEVRWFPLTKELRDEIMPEHRAMFTRFCEIMNSRIYGD